MDEAAFNTGTFSFLTKDLDAYSTTYQIAQDFCQVLDPIAVDALFKQAA